MRRSKKISMTGLYVGILVVAVITAVGCATIIHGTTQSIGVSSTPTNAEVLVDGQSYGNAPVTVELKRKKNHMLRIELEGYEAYETTITRSASAWAFGNLVFGGVIGLAIDAISGGLYELAPDHIHPTLHAVRTSQGLDRDQGAIYIEVVLEPQSNWRKIGQLKRLDTSSDARVGS